MKDMDYSELNRLFLNVSFLLLSALLFFQAVLEQSKSVCCNKLVGHFSLTNLSPCFTLSVLYFLDEFFIYVVKVPSFFKFSCFEYLDLLSECFNKLEKVSSLKSSEDYLRIFFFYFFLDHLLMFI